MPYLLFLKKNGKILNCRLLQIIGGLRCSMNYISFLAESVKTQNSACIFRQYCICKQAMKALAGLLNWVMNEHQTTYLC